MTTPQPPVSRSRFAWKPALIVFGLGVVLWVAYFVWTFVLVRRDAGWYPGIRLPGGEWTGWLGLGWLVQQVFCFGTAEMCAQQDSSPTLTIEPLGLVAYVVVLAALALVIGFVARRRRA